MGYTVRIPAIFLYICIFTLIANSSFGMISIAALTKDAAKEKYGVTMHARGNGDAGVKVWLQFKKEGRLKNFIYTELWVKDSQGKRIISAKLHPTAQHHHSQGFTTVAFSADANLLEQSSFFVVCYDSIEGKVGYYLKVKEFLDLKSPFTEK